MRCDLRCASVASLPKPPVATESYGTAKTLLLQVPSCQCVRSVNMHM